MSRAVLDLELLAELEADDDGGPVEPPTPPPVICPLCSGTAPVYLAMRCGCLLYTSPSPRDVEESRMPSSA